MTDKNQINSITMSENI